MNVSLAYCDWAAERRTGSEAAADVNAEQRTMQAAAREYLYEFW